MPPKGISSLTEPIGFVSVPLGTDYPGQSCSLARTLEIVGERWTLLILRDLFFGVRRFTDLQRHLDVPRAVLTSRLNALVDAGVIERRPYQAGRDAFVLTACGEELWPSVHALMQWGERHQSPTGPRRLFSLVVCGTDLTPGGHCPACEAEPPAAELEMRPGPGMTTPLRDDPVTLALRGPHRLLQPL
jgi:DNA-binding HxlR family transcriptional regulator